METVERFAFGRAAWLLVPWVAGLALAAGCGDSGGAGGSGTVTTNASSSATGGAATCGLPPFPDPTCEACLTASCCTELQACAADPSCRDDATCAASCNFDPPCIAAKCNPSGGPTPTGIDVDECGLSSCLDACPQYQVGCDPLQTGYGQACDTCLKTNCCDAFSPNVDDLDYQKCRLGCSDAACLRACEESHPDAIAHESAQGTCFVDSCHAECENPEGCGVLSSTGDCGACIHDQCCAQHEACSKDASCLDLFSCLTSCSPGFDCDDCLAAWPPHEVGLAMSMLNCSTTTCNGACGGTGPGCGLFDSSEPATCQTCIKASCCSESSACGLDADCVALESCVELCHGDAACIASCNTEIPDGASLFDPLVACESANCPACE